jgi:hypothetical protein
MSSTRKLPFPIKHFNDKRALVCSKVSHPLQMAKPRHYIKIWDICVVSRKNGIWSSVSREAAKCQIII